MTVKGSQLCFCISLFVYSRKLVVCDLGVVQHELAGAQALRLAVQRCAAS